MRSQTFIILVVLVLLVSSISIGQSSFEAGTSALENGDPTAAKENFTQLIEEGKESLELYANLGRSYYEEGDLANAILYYERASRLAPADDEISRTLEVLRREVDIRVSEIPDLILLSGYRSMVTSIGPSAWASIQIILGVLFCYLLYHTLQVGKGDRKLFKQGVIAMGVLSLLSFIFAYSAKNYQLADDSGIVMTESTSILQAPDELSKSVSLLSAGNKVFVIEELGEWYKVRLRDRDEGWIKKEEVIII